MADFATGHFPKKWNFIRACWVILLRDRRHELELGIHFIKVNWWSHHIGGSNLCILRNHPEWPAHIDNFWYALSLVCIDKILPILISNLLVEIFVGLPINEILLHLRVLRTNAVR